MKLLLLLLLGRLLCGLNSLPYGLLYRIGWFLLLLLLWRLQVKLSD
jgi:hypothetical protein